MPFAMIILALTSLIAGQGTLIGWFYCMSLGAAYGSQQAISVAGYAHYFGGTISVRFGRLICRHEPARDPRVSGMDLTGAYSWRW